MLKLMYITNRPEVALIAEEAGVDRIFIDMEYIGKEIRQANIDSVKNHHSTDDVEKMSKTIRTAELLVRINPIHEMSEGYCSTEEEIEKVIQAGADILMLPYFKSCGEVERFISDVGGRTRTILLLETPDAVANIDHILKIRGIDEIHIGINDLSIGYGKKFMFELLVDGTVESICMRLKRAGKVYGFGGIASIGGADAIPAEIILKEHYRLGSSMVILSRSFCNLEKENDMDYMKEKFLVGIRSIRAFEREIMVHSDYFYENEHRVADCVKKITAGMGK